MMRKKWAWAAGLVVGLAIICLHARMTFADDDEHEYRRHESHDEHELREHHEHHEHHNQEFPPVSNSTFAEHCGECHLAYPPGLLPSGSWEKILGDLDNHNGTEVVIGEDDVKTIDEFLRSNAADKTKTKRAAKIMQSLNGQTPDRITEVPYIREKHHDISTEVFQRESIGSRSNCKACHLNADHGIFDDHVTIPN